MSDTDGHDHKRYYCMKCMTYFTSEEKLKQHNADYPLCHNNQPAKIEYPTKDKAFGMFKITTMKLNAHLSYMQILKVFL